MKPRTDVVALVWLFVLGFEVGVFVGHAILDRPPAAEVDPTEPDSSGVYRQFPEPGGNPWAHCYVIYNDCDNMRAI
jgi:hypothetical protein